MAQKQDLPAISLTVAIFWVYLVLLSIVLLIPLPEKEGPPGPDKIIHFTAFLILGSLQFFANRKSIKPFFIILIYAALIETAQGLTGYRSFEWLDMLANFAGCLTSRLLIFFTNNTDKKL